MRMLLLSLVIVAIFMAALATAGCEDRVMRTVLGGDGGLCE